jgi:hypothetical protein
MFRCETCCKPTPIGIRCDECYAATIRGLLSNPEWMRLRGCAAGDLPGETLADTYRRELAAFPSK